MARIVLAAFPRSAEQSYLTLRLTGPHSRMSGRRPGRCHRSRASRMLYRLLLTKFEWPSQPRCSALICLMLLRNLSRVRTWRGGPARSSFVLARTGYHLGLYGAARGRMETLGASNRQGAAGVRISGRGDWLAPAYPAGSRTYVSTSARGGDLRAERPFAPRSHRARFARCGCHGGVRHSGNW